MGILRRSCPRSPLPVILLIAIVTFIIHYFVSQNDPTEDYWYDATDLVETESPTEKTNNKLDGLQRNGWKPTDFNFNFVKPREAIEQNVDHPKNIIPTEIPKIPDIPKSISNIPHKPAAKKLIIKNHKVMSVVKKSRTPKKSNTNLRKLRKFKCHRCKLDKRLLKFSRSSSKSENPLTNQCETFATLQNILDRQYEAKQLMGSWDLVYYLMDDEDTYIDRPAGVGRFSGKGRGYIMDDNILFSNDNQEFVDESGNYLSIWVFVLAC